MIHKSIVKTLICEAEQIEVPNIWDAICNVPINTVNGCAPKRVRKNSHVPVICITTAAMVMLAIIFGFQMLDSPMPSVTDFDKVQSNYAETKPSVFEILCIRKYYGNMQKTKIKKETVEAMLSTVNDIDQIKTVYEDERYLYNFDDNGNLLEMAQIHSQNVGNNVDEETIRNTVAQIFKRYIPNENKDNYIIAVENCAEAYPPWTVTAKRYENDICVANILLTFDGDGSLDKLIIPQQITDNLIESQTISYEKAIEIALSEISKDKYGVILSGNKSDYDIRIDIKSNQNGKYYYVVIGNLPLKNAQDFRSSVGVEIDCDSGEILTVYKYK